MSCTGGLETAPFPGRWRAWGACRRLPTEIFFPTRGEDLDAARAVCAACVVVAECRNYALGVPGLKGVWGGLSEHERELLRQDAGTEAPEPQPDEEQPEAPSTPPRAPVGSLFAALDVVAARPGCWARVAQFASAYSASATASLLRNRRRGVPPGRWRFEGRRNDDGTSELWACYEGAEA